MRTASKALTRENNTWIKLKLLLSPRRLFTLPAALVP